MAESNINLLRENLGNYEGCAKAITDSIQKRC